MDKKLVHIIAGPTASGKSAYALDKAEKTNGTIINADSMQIYDSLHKLTAQPDDNDLKRAQHKLYSLLPPNKKCSAQKWLEMAIKEIEQYDTPIITGGTGFYIKALIEGISYIPKIDEEIRLQAINLQKKLGNPEFHHELSKIDSDIAKKLHPNDTQRLIRAYEVIKHTGKSLIYWQSLPPKIKHNYIFDITIFNLPRETLYNRCNKRFDIMIQQNIIEEVRNLDNKIKSGEIDNKAPITHALGFRPLQQYINDKLTLNEAITISKNETRQYAKRQDTWFKNQIKPKSNIININYKYSS